MFCIQVIVREIIKVIIYQVSDKRFDFFFNLFVDPQVICVETAAIIKKKKDINMICNCFSTNLHLSAGAQIQ
jgi:hypothetical protein